MNIKAQMAMVMNLGKCLACHTCTVLCKNVWTTTEGAEYIWFNNVETKPGIGYPKNGKIRKSGMAAGSLRMTHPNSGLGTRFQERSSFSQMTSFRKYSTTTHPGNMIMKN